jgi:hypothetical protein
VIPSFKIPTDVLKLYRDDGHLGSDAVCFGRRVEAFPTFFTYKKRAETDFEVVAFICGGSEVYLRGVVSA